jgi:hypothetical protein
MLSSFLFCLNLVSATGLGPLYPDPYAGFGAGVFPNRRYSQENGSVTMKLDRDSFTTFGVPLRLPGDPNSEWRFLDLVFTPEVAFTSSILQINLTAGPEFEQKLGYRSRLSGIQWSLQGGIHYANLLSPAHPVGEDGRELSGSDTDSLAFLFSPAFGPRIAITDKLALRFMLNPKVMMGLIAKRTFATKQNDWLGVTMSFYIQLEMSNWLRDL